MKRMNKWISIGLSLCFCLGILPNDIYASEEETIIEESENLEKETIIVETEMFDEEIVCEEEIVEEAFDASFVTSGDYQISTLEDGTIRIVKYIGADTEVVIPSVMDGKTVTVIGNNAFFDQVYLESIVLPDTIQTIESGAFVNCERLTSFVMPDSVTTIGEYLFGRDMELESVTLSHSLTTIPINTFYGCDNLSSVVIPEGITSIGDGAFSYCSSLDTVTIPNSVEIMGEGVFYNSYLKTLILPVSCLYPNTLQAAHIKELMFTDQLTRIEKDGFADAVIGNIILPKSLSYIDPLAFKNGKYNSLIVDEKNPYYCAENNVLYSKDKTQLLHYPNQGLPEEHYFKVPDGVTTIADYAFYGVKIKNNNEKENYMTIDLPSSIQSIGEHAFQNSCITKITIPEVLENISTSAFEDSLISSVELKEGTKEIRAYAFALMTKLETVTIPSTVSYIDPTAFLKCFSIQDVILSEKNPNFIIKDGCIYDATGTTLLLYLPNQSRELEDSTFVIPEGTKAIGDKAFCFSKLKTITIPSSVTLIGEQAFYGCTNLKSITVPSTVTSFGKDCLGYVGEIDGSNKYLIKDFKIITELNSSASKYAIENKIAYYTQDVPTSFIFIEMNTGDCINLDQTGIDLNHVQYTSSNERIAYCDAQGNVKALAPGYTSIVRTCGTDNQVFRIYVTGQAIEDGHVPIDIEMGKDYNYDPSIYAIYMNTNEFHDFLDDFKQHNQNVSYKKLDNNCIVCYSGEEYVALLAARGDMYRMISISNNPAWRQNGLFDLISDGMYEELAKFDANQNVVLYRGVKYVDDITGAGNSVEDMKQSIGKVFTPSTNLSTSLSHDLAIAFSGNTSNGTILEIYAPMEMLNGAYIAGLSQFEGEAEYLINEGAKFLVLDAGVRDISNQIDEEPSLERYMKLLLVENKVTKVNVNLLEPNPEMKLTSVGDVYGVGLDSNKVYVEWMANEKKIDGNADYFTQYSTDIILKPSKFYTFDKQSKIFINEDAYEFELLEDGSALVHYTYSTSGANIAQIDNKKEVKGVQNGISPQELASRLPASTTAIVNGNIVSVPVQWNVENSSYDPLNKNAQAFTINGIALFDAYPQEYLLFADGLTNEMTCDVTVVSDDKLSMPYVKESKLQPGTYTNNIEIHLACDTKEADIYYLMSSTVPSAKEILEKGTVYNGQSISLMGKENGKVSYHIYAISVLKSQDSIEKMSEVASFSYTIVMSKKLTPTAVNLSVKPMVILMAISAFGVVILLKRKDKG